MLIYITLSQYYTYNCFNTFLCHSSMILCYIGCFLCSLCISCLESLLILLYYSVISCSLICIFKCFIYEQPSLLYDYHDTTYLLAITLLEVSKFFPLLVQCKCNGKDQLYVELLLFLFFFFNKFT